MKSQLFLAAVFTGTIGMCALAAGEQPHSSRSDKLGKDNQPGEKKPDPLETHCRKMLDLQIAVFDGTKDLHKVMEKNVDKKPGPKDKESALKLAEKQKVIIAEATATIATLKREGTAVAFVEFFESLIADMKRVQNRLEMGDVGSATQAIENDLIETLKEMLHSLKPR